MRLIDSAIVQTERDFARWVLDIGNGNLHIDAASDDVNIPCNMLVEGNSIEHLIEHMYGSMSNVENFPNFFKERGILAPKNKEVDMINSLGLRSVGGASKEYLSADSLCSDKNQIHHLYTLEFLNTIDLGGGYPPHVLTLKENALIMLLRNLDARRGLCNGTRLICRQLYDRVMEAEIIRRKNTRNIVLIPRIDFITTSSLGLFFEMRRRQFPVRLGFGMTINKAQGQTLGFLGLYLASPVFSHGQLYVAMSCVRSSTAIKIVIDDRKLQSQNGAVSGSARTPNIVYKEMDSQRAIACVVGSAPQNVQKVVEGYWEAESCDVRLYYKQLSLSQQAKARTSKGEEEEKEEEKARQGRDMGEEEEEAKAEGKAGQGVEP
ncbi:hypothetical protein L7F22_010560 [Adiantum nelumboides]|nr:hypothetical protein [Adiantum nelumboides]